MMTSQPLVTVSVVTYNHAPFIKACLDSILTQTYENLQVIVVDDCSTDQTADIVRAIRDPRVRLVTKPKNKGVSDSTRTYLNLAIGEYIATMCGDDTMATPVKIEHQLRFLKDNPRYQAVFSNVGYIDEQGAPLTVVKRHSFLFDAERLFTGSTTIQGRAAFLRYFFDRGNTLCGPTLFADMVVFKTLGPFDPRFEQLQDFDMWVRMLIHGFEFAVLPERLVNYRVLKNNMNLSAPTPKKMRKIMYEQPKILENYLAITSLELFLEIFPEYASDGAAPDVRLIPFYLAQAALKRGTPEHRKFAVQALHTLLNDAPYEIIDLLEDRHRFTLRDYYEVMALNPLGSALYPDKRGWFRG